MSYEELVKLLEERKNYFSVDIGLPGRHSGIIWIRRNPLNTPNQIEEEADWLFKHRNSKVRQTYIIGNNIFRSTRPIPEWLMQTVIDFVNSGEKELRYEFW